MLGSRDCWLVMCGYRSDRVVHLPARAIETDAPQVPSPPALTTARAFHLPANEAFKLDLARPERLSLATLYDTLRAASRAGAPLLS